MFTFVALLALSGIAGAVVLWSMSWESAWPGGERSEGAGRPADAEPAEAETEVQTEAETEVLPPPSKRHRSRRAAAAGTGATPDGIPAAVAIIEHGEPYAPPSILSRLWAMLRLVLVVAVACGLIAGAIYYAATSISKLFGHGGG